MFEFVFLLQLFWLICTGAGLGYGMEQFMDNTIFTIPIAPGTPSESGVCVYACVFGHRVQNCALCIAEC